MNPYSQQWAFNGSIDKKCKQTYLYEFEEVSANHTNNFRSSFILMLLLTGEEHGRMSQLVIISV